MPHPKIPSPFLQLTWDDIEVWAGEKIAARGKSYQKQGRVSELAITEEGGLLAWVDGTRPYATYVTMLDDDLPDAVCTCPYACDCKHGVAVVMDYLEHIRGNRSIPVAGADDERLSLVSDTDDFHDAPSELSEKIEEEIKQFITGKTKAELIELVQGFARRYPDIAKELLDLRQIAAGNFQAVVARVHEEIQVVSNEPGWRNYWDGEGYTPDYSGIRQKLTVLLQAGQVDELLSIGKTLLTEGVRQLEQCDDDGETGREITACLDIIVAALIQSPLEAADKLHWALTAVLDDPFDISEPFAAYLHQQHPQPAWSQLADRLLTDLNSAERPPSGRRDVDHFDRDMLTRYIAHALEHAGRSAEIMPLYKQEATFTQSYYRLVQRLIEEDLLGEAEHWIEKGIKATQKESPGIAARLRDLFVEIKTKEKNWTVVAAIQVEKFVRHPSDVLFKDCQSACKKNKQWPQVRPYLLNYLETGRPPWKQPDWPLPESGLPMAGIRTERQFPLIHLLIDIAILEKQPDQVLKWYDQRSKNDRLHYYYANTDTIADAVQDHAPERSVVMWKNLAEQCIARVKPSAYKEAAGYLRKAAAVMEKEKKTAQWQKYISQLRQEHARKRRLLEILDDMDKKPILSKGGGGR